MADSKPKIVLIKKGEKKIPWTTLEDLLKDKGIREQSVHKYLTLMRRCDEKILGYRDEYCHWEKFGSPDNIRTVLSEIINSYKMTQKNLLSYLTQIKKVLEIVPDKDPEWIQPWETIIQEVYQDFNAFIVKYHETEYESDIRQRQRKTIEQQAIPWDTLVTGLDACIENTVDPRIRALALVYRYGYVLRPYELNHTMIEDDQVHNFIDLDKCIWNIRMSTTYRRTFDIPEKLCKKLRDITSSHRSFAQGFLTPKRDGSSYKGSDGFYKTWTDKYNMETANTYRHSYESWIADRKRTVGYKLEEFTKILGHRMSDKHITYLLPYA